MAAGFIPLGNEPPIFEWTAHNPDYRKTVVEVTLSPDLQALSEKVGLSRQAEAEAKGRKHVGGRLTDDVWGTHIQGASGEIVVANYLGIPFPGETQKFGEPGDLGPLIEVRTASEPRYGLIIRTKDPADSWFIHVTCAVKERWDKFLIWGFLHASECTVLPHIRDMPRLHENQAHSKKPHWCVPARAMYPIQQFQQITGITCPGLQP